MIFLFSTSQKKLLKLEWEINIIDIQTDLVTDSQKESDTDHQRKQKKKQ